MKNIPIKWTGVALLLSLALMQQSCQKKFLDVDPQAQQPSVQFWQGEADITKAVNAAYANLREWKQTAFAAIAVESMGSDEAEKGSSTGDATYMNDYDNFTVSASQGQVLDFWNGQYQEVNLANQVLDHIDTIKMDATLKARYIGECKFLRAYSYFRLVRAFGDVPLRMHLPKDASEFNIPRTPKTQVWAAIEQDLTDAAAVLPQSYGVTDVGRATKGAALALHAKAAMYQTKDNTARWADVLTYTNQVMALGYTLFPSFEGLFRIPNENNSESIFEIQAQRLPAISGASNSQYSQVQGVRGATWGGWGFNVPTQTLVDAFEAGDPRRDATIIFRGETTPQGDVVAATGDNPRYNQKSYVPSAYYVSGFTEGADQNVRVLRYADVLLMNAEAANEIGGTANVTLALADLEKVRARARGGNTAILPAVTTTDKAQLRTAIWHERQVELAMEFDRFFDVIRQGRGAAVFGAKGFKTGINEVMPIPQNEIDVSAGVLTQNPGY